MGEKFQGVGGRRALGEHLVHVKDEVSKLTYGQSITDACLNWDDSVATMEELSQAVLQRRQAAVAGVKEAEVAA